MVTAAIASRKKLSIVSATSESVDNRVVSVDRPMTAGLGTLTVSDFFSNNNNKKRLFVYIVVYLFVHLFTCVFVYYQPHITTTDWIGPAPFPGRMSYKATKPGLAQSVVYLSMFYVLWFIRAPFYVLLVFVAMCSVFWLFWLSYQHLPSDWQERLL